MESDEKIQPLVPPNYVSLADLQQRWIKQQQQQEREREKEKRETENERCEPSETHSVSQDQVFVKIVKKHGNSRFQKLDSPTAKSNPNRRQFRGNNRDRKAFKENRLDKSNPDSKLAEIEAAPSAVVGINAGDRVRNDQVDDRQKSEVEKKVKKKKKKRKNKKKQQNPATEEQTAVAEERKPERGGGCGEKRRNRVKQGDEAPLKVAVVDQTVKIEDKLKKLSVTENGRNNGRSTAVIEGRTRTYRAHRGAKYRGMGKTRRENVYVWLKKGEASEHALMK